MLYEYLPKLRGITVYPDGARGGQPLTPATYDEAIANEGVVFEEDPNAACASGQCGT
jgi:ribonucleoside-diphosphate reductase alpha chain